MKLYPLVDISAYTHFNSSDLLELCLASDLSKPLFIIKTRPLRNVGSLIFYIQASDVEEEVVCTVSQACYKLADNYKIELCFPHRGYDRRESFYLSDFAQIIRSGHFSVIDQNNVETKNSIFSKLGNFLNSLL